MSTVSSTPTSGNLHFQVDARHVRQLGQQLVGDKVTALVELVKNSYDADATRVALTFDLNAVAWVDRDGNLYTAWESIPPGVRSATGNLRTLEGLITVDDDGSGMTLSTIAGSWMRIASADKEDNATSPVYGRARAGRKGIGRFSAESLGQHLILRTSVAGSARITTVRFDWIKDYNSGVDLSKVSNPYESDSVPEGSHGTRLEIRGLHERWTEPQRARVARSLLLLQPPYTHPDDAGGEFSVRYVVDGQDAALPDINDFLENGTAFIEGSVEDDGRVILRVRSAILDFDRTEELPLLALVSGSFKVSGAYFVYRKDAIGVPIRQANKLAFEYGGVRVYRDGLRLLPYGERHDDWLGLDESSRRREYLNPIGNQNFFVQALLTRSANPLLEDMSSREGLLNNEAFQEFRDVIRSMLLTASTWVAEHRQRRAKGGSSTVPDRPKEPRAGRADLMRTAVDSILHEAGKSLPPVEAEKLAANVTRIVETSLEDAAGEDEDEKQEIKELQTELELLRVLSSLGTSISIFSHEIRTIINATRRALKAGTIEDSELHLDGLTELAKYIDGFTAESRRRSREPVPFTSTIEDFVKQFARVLAPHVDVSWAVEPRALRSAPISPTTVHAILINLFTNAVKAVDVETVVERKIRLTVAAAGMKMVRIRVQDSGVGIPDKIQARVFDAFVTGTASDRNELGIGTGLGLKVVSDLAEEYGGYAEIGEPEHLYKTAMDVFLPRWEKQYGNRPGS